jgi:hypothetical protein
MSQLAAFVITSYDTSFVKLCQWFEQLRRIVALLRLSGTTVALVEDRLKSITHQRCSQDTT